MHWKDLEEIIHDNAVLLKEEQVESLSTKLLKELKEGTKPLQAARIGYALVLLQLKTDPVNEKSALQFFKHLVQILKHEIQVTEGSSEDHSSSHLIYVRKLAEQYFHHLMLIAELKGADRLVKKVHALRRKNHEKLLKLQRSTQTFWKREEQLIQKTLKEHYLFAGFLLAIALYFAWSSFWTLSDTALAHWVYSEYGSAQFGDLLQNVFLLLFSLTVIAGFVSYQKQEAREDVEE